MKLQQLLEALKPSQYRNLVKGWDKSKYADLFGRKYRIYIPLGEKSKDVKVNPQVENFVKSQGYEIEDYLTGIASKDNGKRKIRIGKLLANETELKKIFDNDSSRNSSQSEYIVVISRHPYDIAGMTSGRDWEEGSCMNLETGTNKHYVPLDIKEGTLVAYLIKNTDKNIESPAARVLIKPFVNIDGSKEVAFGVEKTVYGKPSPEFQQTVVDWANEINKKKKLNGIFQLNDKLYNDSFKELYGNARVFGDESNKDKLIKLTDKQQNELFSTFEEGDNPLRNFLYFGVDVLNKIGAFGLTLQQSIAQKFHLIVNDKHEWKEALHQLSFLSGFDAHGLVTLILKPMITEWSVLDEVISPLCNISTGIDLLNKIKKDKEAYTLLLDSIGFNFEEAALTDKEIAKIFRSTSTFSEFHDDLISHIKEMVNLGLIEDQDTIDNINIALSKE